MYCIQEHTVIKSDDTPNSTGVKLLYFGRSYQQVRGGFTGYIYHFSPLHPIQFVDSRDARLMTRMRIFRQIQ